MILVYVLVLCVWILQNDQERRIRNVGNDPDVIHEGDRKKLETIKKIFEAECGKFPDGKFANSAGSPSRIGQPSDIDIDSY